MAVKRVKAKTETPKKALTKRVRFQFLAAEAGEVYLAGEFNNWNTNAHPMKKDKNGVWEITVSLKPGRYEYRFFVDGIWQNDISCDECVANDFGSVNCVRIVE